MEIEKLVEQIADEVYKRLNNAPAPQYSGSGTAPAAADDGEIDPKSIAKMIDHTVLKPETPADRIRSLCKEAAENNFASVCVNPYFIQLAKELLRGTNVNVCCVIGFPLGANTTESKVFETIDAVNKGAVEVDMVINISAVKSGDWEYAKRDIEEVVNCCRGKAIVKVIIETCLLTDEEKVKACTVSKLAGAAFVKTSTGFSTGGATIEDVKLMRSVVGPDMGVKASGGVREYELACKMIKAGANRFGTSGGIAITSGKNKAAVATGCINCGKCSQKCPSGTVNIIKNDY